MNESEDEKALSALIYTAIQESSLRSERAAQASEFKAGVSDLGYCSERLRRMLDQQSPDDTDVLAAFLGTCIGDGVEKAVTRLDHGWIAQPGFTVRLKSGSHTYDIPGHGDLAHPDGTVVDIKTTRGLSIPEKGGAEDRQKKFQRHLQGLGLHQSGWFNEGVKVEDVVVGNAWIDRAGDDKYVLTHLEPFSWEVVREATEWLEEVIYAFTHKQEAAKEPAREVCAATCGFFGTCRAFDTDVKGLLSDSTVLIALEQYNQGKNLEREGKRLKDQSRAALEGVDGFALIDGERHALRWTWVNESDVPGYTRKGYYKIDLRRVR